MKELSLKDKQKVSWELLLEFKNVCEKHNLKYYLFYGTLIGAVRHGGFIPWDDDVDVVMPRPDFDRFLKIYEGSSRYKLLSFQSQKDYVFPYLKLCDSSTYAILSDGTKSSRGVGIDIFALDGQADDFDLENDRFLKRKKVFEKYCLMAEGIRHLANTKKIKDSIRRITANFMLHSGIINYILKRMDANISKKNYDDSVYVSVAQEVYSNGYRRWQKTQFGEGAILNFENERFVVPMDYIQILTDIYGDFMTPPPVEKRETTHFEKYYSE